MGQECNGATLAYARYDPRLYRGYADLRQDRPIDPEARAQQQDHERDQPYIFGDRVDNRLHKVESVLAYEDAGNDHPDNPRDLELLEELIENKTRDEDKKNTGDHAFLYSTCGFIRDNRQAYRSPSRTRLAFRLTPQQLPHRSCSRLAGRERAVSFPFYSPYLLKKATT